MTQDIINESTKLKSVNYRRSILVNWQQPINMRKVDREKVSSCNLDHLRWFQIWLTFFWFFVRYLFDIFYKICRKKPLSGILWIVTGCNVQKRIKKGFNMLKRPKTELNVTIRPIRNVYPFLIRFISLQEVTERR